MTFTAAGREPVVLSLPAWTPGAYEISNYARFVLDFAASSGTGAAARALRWDKADHDTWRVFPEGAGPVQVSFTYVAGELNNAHSWSQPDFLLFNGTNVFLYPEGRSLDFRSQLTVRTDASWRIATSMPRVAEGSYSAGNYHDLVDMPFFVGRFDLDSMRISGTWVRYATYPVGSVSGAARQEAWDQLTRVIPPQVAVSTPMTMAGSGGAPSAAALAAPTTL
jgi:predicted metalloprotease with PDZ domain